MGRAHVASWAEVETVLAAELVSGNDDPRAQRGRTVRGGRSRRYPSRPDRGGCGCGPTPATSPGSWPGSRSSPRSSSRSAPNASPRSGGCWTASREDDWTDAIDMDGAQVAVADYRPVWWPAKTFLLIRRVRLDISQVSADPALTAPPHPAPRPTRPPPGRARRRGRDLRLLVHPHQPRRVHTGQSRRRSSTGTDTAPASKTCSATANTAPRSATSPPAIPRSTPPGCGARCWPPAMAAWLHQLTATARPDRTALRLGRPRRQSHDRHPPPPADPRPRPPRSPGRTSNPAPTTRPRPARRDPRPTPETPHTALTTRPPTAPTQEPRNREPGATPGPPACPHTTKPAPPHDSRNPKINSADYSRIRVRAIYTRYPKNFVIQPPVLVGHSGPIPLEVRVRLPKTRAVEVLPVIVDRNRLTVPSDDGICLYMPPDGVRWRHQVENEWHRLLLRDGDRVPVYELIPWTVVIVNVLSLGSTSLGEVEG